MCQTSIFKLLFDNVSESHPPVKKKPVVFKYIGKEGQENFLKLCSIKGNHE
jgi:hypothetical protein